MEPCFTLKFYFAVFVHDTFQVFTKVFILPVDGLLALVAGGAAVQALVLVAAEGQELLHHVQHADELAENQHLCRTGQNKKKRTGSKRNKYNSCSSSQGKRMNELTTDEVTTFT